MWLGTGKSAFVRRTSLREELGIPERYISRPVAKTTEGLTETAAEQATQGADREALSQLSQRAYSPEKVMAQATKDIPETAAEQPSPEEIRALKAKSLAPDTEPLKIAKGNIAVLPRVTKKYLATSQVIDSNLIDLLNDTNGINWFLKIGLSLLEQRDYNRTHNNRDSSSFFDLPVKDVDIATNAVFDYTLHSVTVDLAHLYGSSSPNGLNIKPSNDEGRIIKGVGVEADSNLGDDEFALTVNRLARNLEMLSRLVVRTCNSYPEAQNKLHASLNRALKRRVTIPERREEMVSYFFSRLVSLNASLHKTRTEAPVKLVSKRYLNPEPPQNQK